MGQELCELAKSSFKPFLIHMRPKEAMHDDLEMSLPWRCDDLIDLCELQVIPGELTIRSLSQGCPK